MRTTTTLIAENIQEQIVREYFEAFISRDVDSMMENVHPAIYHQRSIDGRLNVSINGIQNFKNFVILQTSDLNEQTFQVSAVKQDKQYRDRVEAAFSIMQYRENNNVQLTGCAVFWFTDERIIQLAVEMSSHPCDNHSAIRTTVN